MDADVTSDAHTLDHDIDGLGERLRHERVKAGLSQRELARRVGLSASLISQLENGQSKPSVGTLYALVTELDVSLDHVIKGEGDAGAAGGSSVRSSERASPLVHPSDRKAIELASGVRWEDLTSSTEEAVDFLEAIYEVGGASTPDESLMRHHGREYGYVITGTLGVQIGFDEYTLSPGDSIAFDSTRPHRLFNKGDVPVRAIWVVVGSAAEHAHDQAP